MEASMELFLKTAVEFDLDMIKKLSEIIELKAIKDPYRESSSYRLVVIDIDSYYELAIELLNNNSKAIFILICDHINEKYQSLFINCRVKIVERAKGLDSSISSLAKYIELLKYNNDSALEYKTIIKLLLFSNEVNLGNIENHNVRVSIITNELLKNLNERHSYGLKGDDIRLISEAALLHDIGKAYIPKNILFKPNKLTSNEYEIVKTHTTIGATIVSDRLDIKSNRLAKYTYEVCRWHHERYDGSGYPDGLKGDAIPFSAQAVGIADVYDALVSKRIYKDSIEASEAIGMIKAGSCGEFNPILVNSLIEILNKPRNKEFI